VRYLAVLLLAALVATGELQSGETSIQDALEKARRRAGAPASDAKAKQEAARREAARQQALKEKLRKAQEEAARKASEAKAANEETTTPPAAQPKAEKKVIRVFKLKDGTQIDAVMVIELQDTYALKDKDGKLHEVKKKDVESIEESDKETE